jgi:hypothetical protein
LNFCFKKLIALISIYKEIEGCYVLVSVFLNELLASEALDLFIVLSGVLQNLEEVPSFLFE